MYFDEDLAYYTEGIETLEFTFIEAVAQLKWSNPWVRHLAKKYNWPLVPVYPRGHKVLIPKAFCEKRFEFLNRINPRVEELREVEEETKELQQEITILTDTIGQLNQQINTLNLEALDKQTIINNLHQTIETLTLKTQAVNEHELNTYKQLIESLTQQNQLLNNQLKDKDKLIDTLDDSLTRERSLTHEAIQSKNAELQALNHQLTAAQGAIQKYKTPNNPGWLTKLFKFK